MKILEKSVWQRVSHKCSQRGRAQGVMEGSRQKIHEKSREGVSQEIRGLAKKGYG